jgi:hypothetical protein
MAGVVTVEAAADGAEADGTGGRLRVEGDIVEDRLKQRRA